MNELELLQMDFADLAAQKRQLAGDLVELKAENERLRKALQAFADEDNWSKVATIDGWCMTAWNEDGDEPSTIARKALGGSDE